jgi:[histone H3]-lysine36 N-dimethyltransferase SETMAR
VSQKSEKFNEKIMIVGAITGRGVVPLIKVPPNVKINSDYYVENVLKPILEDSVAKLYPGELDKVFVHHDMATSHTSRKTAAYAQDLKDRLGITIISKDQIPVKTPDGSPMDFFGFGYLKQRLHLRRASTLDGVWKLAQKEWNSVSMETVKKVYDSWKRRLRMIAKVHGEHVEHTKNIHRRKL